MDPSNVHHMRDLICWYSFTHFANTHTILLIARVNHFST